MQKNILSRTLRNPVAGMALLALGATAHAGEPFAIATDALLPDAMVGVGYCQPLEARGGTGPYAWEIIDPDAFPPCLNAACVTDWESLGSDGPLLTTVFPDFIGVPQDDEAGSYLFALRVTDAAGASAEKVFSLFVQENPVQTPAPKSAPKSAPPGGSGTISGSSVNWSRSGTTVTLSGSGAMPRYVNNNYYEFPYQQYASQITSIVIGEGITYISEYAFSMFPNVTSISLPNSLRAIGAFAFKGITGLTSVTIPCGAVHESAFINCSGLTTVTIGPGVTQFGISAFEGCTSITRVNISDLAAWCRIDFGGVYANPMSPIGGVFGTRHLYLNGSPITNLVIPPGVDRVPDFAFDNCPDITEVTIPSYVRSIGEYAFQECSNLRTVHVAEGLESIGSVAFSGTACTSFDFPGTLKYIGSYAFNAVPLLAMRINSGYIGKYAFVNCAAMWLASIGKDVIVDDHAFLNCAALRNSPHGGSVISTPVTVPFGMYNGQDIRWMVLKVKDGSALLLSEKILENVQFYEEHDANTRGWADSDVRQWLNDTFYNVSFSSGDKLKIKEASLPSGGNPVYGTDGGYATCDNIFLLSAEEAVQYMPTPQERAAITLAANEDPGSHNDSVGGTGYWWLRNTGIAEDFAMYVDYCGYLRYDGANTTNPKIFGVRPAMWVDAAALGISVETTTRGSSPDFVTHPFFAAQSKIYDFVARLYALCLNRVPDMDGCVYWVDQLRLGWKTGAEVAYGFFMSAEMTNRHLSNSEYIDVLYNVMMGRGADLPGKTYWLEAMNSGVSPAGALRGFAESAEFTSICIEYGIVRGSLAPSEPRDVNFGVTMFVARCYTKALGRAFDIGGLNSWCNLINTASNPKGMAIYVSTTGFFDSQEFQIRGLSNSAFVDVLYQTFLGREPDPGGKAGWVAQLDAGVDRHFVMAGFYNSAEFSAIMASYGIY